MNEYHVQLNEIEANRKELASAEKLFNLPLTQYPQIINIQKELSGLDQLFNIYLKQKVSGIQLLLSLLFMLI
ncbi:unnamed protein product [Trichobilharzia regenti]|nr:unnamed protein product [Trichobilharzia regenti]